jgi:LysM repeat protein
MRKILSIIGLLILLPLDASAKLITVQPGDTLSKISRSVNLTWQELWKLNPRIKNPNLIYPGQELETEGYVSKDDPQLGSTLPVAGVTYSLAGSGVTASATSITLTSLTIPQTGYELQDSDFSSTFYVTFEPGNTKRQEIASCTTVVQNADNSATLSGCTRGLLPFSPYTASSTYRFPHAGGTQLIFSDPPQLFNEYPAKGNNELITGQWQFTTRPTSTTSTPTDQAQLVTLYDLQQATSTGGSNNSETIKGVCELSTSAEAALGTTLGSTGARLCLPGSLATSSPQVVGTYVVITSSTGKISSDFGGTTSSVATLDASTLVVQNPANATSTPTANKIPIANASSTLDNWITATTSFPFFPNTLPTENTYYTYTVPLITTSTNISGPLVGWTQSGGANINNIRVNNFVSSSISGGSEQSFNLMGTSSLFAQFNESNEVRVKFRARAGNNDDIGNLSVLNIGFIPVQSNLNDAVAGTNARIVFALGALTSTSTSVTSITANGSAVTSNAITGIDGAKWHTYEIIYTNTSAQFYVDGILKFTHTTNLPSSGTVLFGMGNDTNTAILKMTDPVFTQQL